MSTMKVGERVSVKFCYSGCVTPMRNVRLYRYEDGSLELWHYSSNVLNIDSDGNLHLGDKWNYGNLTKKLCRDFARQYGVEDQYDEERIGFKTTKRYTCCQKKKNKSTCK